MEEIVKDTFCLLFYVTVFCSIILSFVGFITMVIYLFVACKREMQDFLKNKDRKS